MNLDRGDIGLARFPHAAGGRGKKRPVLVVQNNVYKLKTRHVIVAEITSNPTAGGDPAALAIDVSTPEGKATGLAQDSLVVCLQLSTMTDERIGKVIGRLSPTLMAKLDDCLKAALQLT
jgi:mRNA interferase MazF